MSVTLFLFLVAWRVQFTHGAHKETNRYDSHHLPEHMTPRGKRSLAWAVLSYDPRVKGGSDFVRDGSVLWKGDGMCG